jgi:hypothetical protein
VSSYAESTVEETALQPRRTSLGTRAHKSGQTELARANQGLQPMAFQRVAAQAQIRFLGENLGARSRAQ